MLGYYDLLVQEERSEELLRQAERERLVHIALSNSIRNGRLYCRALGWLGSQMVGWGHSLQKRYGTAATAV